MTLNRDRQLRKSVLKALWVATFLIGSIAGTRGMVAAVAPQVLNIGNGAEPKDLDPHIVTGVPEFHILQNLFEPLVGKDPKTLAPIPAVAESWTTSKDGKTYTFKLRGNAKWSNGEAVTAADFVYSWTRLLTPAIASEYAQQGYYFKHGKDFNVGKLKDASQLGFKATDARTLVATLENPTPFFLSLLYHHSMYPVHQATIEKFGPRWTRPENIVTNGAFSLAKWEMNKIISLKPNPNYWDRAKVELAEVNFLPVEKLDTEEKMYRSNELHVTNEIPLEKIPFWQEEKSDSYQQYPYLGSYFYWINITKAPLNNKLVRQALNLAIDRERIVKFVTRGGQLPAQFFVPPGTGGYQPQAKLPADDSQIEKARELLAKAGYKIIEKNYRCPLGEIDCIAQRQGRTAFIEIKTRSDHRFGRPEESVHAMKQKRLVQIAQWYLKAHQKIDARVSFDVLAITWKKETEPEFRLIENAFNANMFS